jgi:hypothetical protein
MPERVETEDQFVRRWSERAFDISQLAAMAAIRDQLHDYAMHAWRPMSILPPHNKLLICACEDGLQLMLMGELGSWRSNLGQPRKAPHAWMPAPIIPGGDGQGE